MSKLMARNEIRDEMSQNRWISFPVPFLFQKIVTCFFLEMPLFSESDGKMGHFMVFEHKPRMNVFDFGAYQRKMQMPSHDKCLIRMLFGAFSWYLLRAPFNWKKYPQKDIFDWRHMRSLFGHGRHSWIFGIFEKIKYFFNNYFGYDF